MIIILLAQMRQSIGCKSVRNDEIFNLHLGLTLLRVLKPHGCGMTRARNDMVGGNGRN